MQKIDNISRKIIAKWVKIDLSYEKNCLKSPKIVRKFDKNEEKEQNIDKKIIINIVKNHQKLVKNARNDQKLRKNA